MSIAFAIQRSNRSAFNDRRSIDLPRIFLPSNSFRYPHSDRIDPPRSFRSPPRRDRTSNVERIARPPKPYWLEPTSRPTSFISCPFHKRFGVESTLDEQVSVRSLTRPTRSNAVHCLVCLQAVLALRLLVPVNLHFHSLSLLRYTILVLCSSISNLFVCVMLSRMSFNFRQFRARRVSLGRAKWQIKTIARFRPRLEAIRK